MTFTKFLLLDLSLIFLGIPLLMTLQARKAKESLLETFNRSTLQLQIDATSNIPSRNELIRLETLARREGSGIAFNSLMGSWKFLSVWKQGTDEEDSISSSLLRLFEASLELRKDQISKEPEKFTITNSIRFGRLSIRFVGSGELTGSQPLLSFFFESIELNLGERVLLHRVLDIPEDKNRPFFALIAIDRESGKWLGARGRGGGIALWLKES